MTNSDGTATQQTIEQLQQRFNALDRRKIQAETNLASANKRLEELKREAIEQYGTDNLEELRTKLAEMKSENERKRAAYQEQLDKIESDLAAVEKTFQAEVETSTESAE